VVAIPTIAAQFAVVIPMIVVRHETVTLMNGVRHALR
jgi:hypothetical protein